ncbi:MAG: hypothetical protein IJ404_03975 [Clostridia bacterium]|nr:hypothetical protein [Clostridia bacterium]
MTTSKFKISNKVFGVLLCLAMLLSCVLLSSLTAFAADNTKTVYINGVNGNDENDGTSADTPVLTIKKAVELAGKDGTIIVMQAVNINPTVIQKNEFTLEDLTIERWESYTTGDLFNVQGSSETDIMKITLKNVTVDGKNISLSDNWNALIQLGNYSELVIEEGAKLINNNSVAVYATSATANVRMTGGEISGNYTKISQANSPGVYIDEGTFEMSGGTIKNNTNTFFFGGGVYIDYGTFIMTGGTICDNVAHSGGGGVAINEGEFIMSGGSIVNNTADCNNIEGHGNETTYGGGVYAYDLYGSNDTELKITISGGEVSGNDAAFGDAMSIMSTSTKTTVSMSGSPKIVEEIDIGPKSTAKPVNITADFTPATPVTLNLWGAAANTAIATYASGLTPNPDAFSSYVNTLAPIVFEQNIILSDLSVSLSSEEFVYNGSDQKPIITVKKGETVLTEGTDYTVTFSTDCKNVGDKTVTVNFTGNYSGTIKKTFKINKRSVTVIPDAKTKTYGEADTTLTYTVGGEGLASGETLSGSLSREQGEDVGSYAITLGTITQNDNPNYDITLLQGVKFTIEKADQNAPAVQSSNETVSGKNDGSIGGVNETMEYRKDGDNDYIAISGDTIENLAAGKYYVRVKGDSNHNPSPDTEVTIAAGRKLKVTFTDETGVYLTVDADYGETITMPEVPTKDGYTVTWEKEAGTVTADMTIGAVYTKIPADTNSPQTADDGNLWMWLALLFVSGGAAVTFICDRKRKTTIK